MVRISDGRAFEKQSLNTGTARLALSAKRLSPFKSDPEYIRNRREGPLGAQSVGLLRDAQAAAMRTKSSVALFVFTPSWSLNKQNTFTGRGFG